MSTSKSKYIVYCLYTNIEGIFYIGSGNMKRLRYTVSTAYYTLCNKKYKDNSLKAKYIRACRGRIEVNREVVAEFDRKEDAESLEYMLISMYAPILVNVKGNRKFFVNKLPAFLMGVHA